MPKVLIMSKDGERGLFYHSNTEIIPQVQKEDRSMHLGQGGMREASRNRSHDNPQAGPLSLAGFGLQKKEGVQEQ